MVTRRTPLEPDDLLELPLPEGVSGYELVDGELVPVSPASFQHGGLIMEVGRLLANYIEARGLGGRVVSDAGFVLGLARNPRRLRGPDVGYLSERTLQEFGDPGARFARFTPDLAVEIDLRSKRKPGGQQRIRDYLEAGVPLVWSIDPRTRSAVVSRQGHSPIELSEHAVLDGDDVIPGFRLPLADLFK